MFASLTQLSDLLESYGGHELAAGFTILEENIPAFREAVCQLARNYYHKSGLRTLLRVDCAVPAELLTMANVEALSSMEPCGAGCPRPVFLLEHLQIEHLTPVGGGRHLRLRLRQGRIWLNAICFPLRRKVWIFPRGSWWTLPAPCKSMNSGGTAQSR